MPKRSDPASNFTLTLTNFAKVRHRKKRNIMVRFKLAWHVSHSYYGDLGMLADGCLLTRDKQGELTWSTPKSRAGFRNYQNVFPTKDLHKLVFDLLIANGYGKFVSSIPDKDVRYRKFAAEAIEEGEKPGPEIEALPGEITI